MIDMETNKTSFITEAKSYINVFVFAGEGYGAKWFSSAHGSHRWMRHSSNSAAHHIYLSIVAQVWPRGFGLIKSLIWLNMARA